MSTIDFTRVGFTREQYQYVREQLPSDRLPLLENLAMTSHTREEFAKLTSVVLRLLVRLDPPGSESGVSPEVSVTASPDQTVAEPSAASAEPALRSLAARRGRVTVILDRELAGNPHYSEMHPYNPALATPVARPVFSPEPPREVVAYPREIEVARVSAFRAPVPKAAVARPNPKGKPPLAPSRRAVPALPVAIPVSRSGAASTLPSVEVPAGSELDA
jgi:hypothetical protein